MLLLSLPSLPSETTVAEVVKTFGKNRSGSRQDFRIARQTNKKTKLLTSSATKVADVVKTFDKFKVSSKTGTQTLIPTQILWLFLAGGFGTLARYALGTLVQRWTNSTLPWGTLAVNIVGCLLFGVIVSLAAQRDHISDQTRLMILVGFLGAFTTFSSFAYDAGTMIQSSDWTLACLTIAAHNGLGITAFLVGNWLATKL